MSAFESIPHIDLAPLWGHSSNGLEEVALRVRDIYTSVGFAYLVNHRVAQELIRSAFQAAEEFHSLPLEKKLSIKQNKFFRSYTP